MSGQIHPDAVAFIWAIWTSGVHCRLPAEVLAAVSVSSPAIGRDVFTIRPCRPFKLTHYRDNPYCSRFTECASFRILPFFEDWPLNNHRLVKTFQAHRHRDLRYPRANFQLPLVYSGIGNYVAS